MHARKGETRARRGDSQAFSLSQSLACVKCRMVNSCPRWWLRAVSCMCARNLYTCVCARAQSIFMFLSIFNFNIDITAPECAMPSLGYKTKWMFVEGVPAAVLLSFVLLHLLQYTRKRMLGRTKKLHSHLPALVGTAFIMMYYLYLNLTRSILDVFNCEKLVPDMDGKKYLRTCPAA